MLPFLLAWPNVPFTMAALLAVLFFAVHASGVLDAHHDAHAHLDHADGGARVPVTLAAQAFAIVFAATGLALNAHAIDAPERLGLMSLLWTIPLASLGGYGAVAALRRLLAPLFATREDATSRAELVGKSAVVTSTRVSQEFGEVRVLDKSGHELFVTCRLLEGSDAVPHGADVVIVECEGGELVVAPLDERKTT
jgi:hypothetical protein